MKKLLLSVAAALSAAVMITTSVFAAPFTPSVEQKGAPEIVTVKDKDGNDVVAIIRDKDGNEIVGVPSGELLVTPISKSEEAPEEIQKMLNDAYEQIKQSGMLTELTNQINEHIRAYNKALREELGEEAAEKEEISVEDLVVFYLFDVSVFGAYKDYLAEEGNSITIRFKVGVDPDKYLAVLHNYTGDKWEVISNDRVIRHANGDVSVTFDSLSPVAFVVNRKEIEGYADSETGETGDKGPVSPQTGDIDFTPWVVMAVVAAGAVVFAARKAHKRG